MHWASTGKQASLHTHAFTVPLSYQWIIDLSNMADSNDVLLTDLLFSCALDTHVANKYFPFSEWSNCVDKGECVLLIRCVLHWLVFKVFCVTFVS